MTCAICGTSLPAEARFCWSCGAPTAPASVAEERRLVTVLFVDLVDSTGLTLRLDPERARDIIAAFYDAASEELRRQRGQVEKFIGDAIMSVFGLQGAYEDDALRALRAGLAIEGRAQRLSAQLSPDAPLLRVRVGIESGDVAVGPGLGGQQLLTGRVVNVAARLQSAAAPGEVLVGETSYALTRGFAEFGGERQVAAKGFPRPLRARPVQRLTARSGRRTIPLVGRGAELRLMQQGLTMVIETGRPHLFTVLGEAGIGKSRLVDELLASITPPVRTLRADIPPPELGSPFAPLAQMLRDLVDADESQDAAQTLAALRDSVLTDVEDADRLSERLALLLHEPTADEEVSTFRQEATSGFVGLVAALAGRAPLVLAFDGIERADPALLDLVERLAARPSTGEPRPVLVLASGRPEALDDRARWGARADNHSAVSLAALSREESLDLARQSGSGRIDEPAATQVAARAGGNPFFIIEMTGMLLGGEGADDAVRTVLPPTVQAVVSARLDRLSRRLRELARHLSVFAVSFDAGELPLVATATAEDLAGLVEAEVLVRDDEPRPRWRFRHETLRDVAYATLTKRERRTLHERVADGLIAQGRRFVWAADHLERAARAALDLDPATRELPDRAAVALAEAADLARRRMDSRAAADLYERSLALCGPEPTWARRETRILAGLGEARYWLGEYARARTALARAVALAEQCGDDWALSVALRFEADIVLNADGDNERAQVLSDRAVAAAQRSGDDRVLTRALLFAGWPPWNREDFATADSLWLEALSRSRANGDRWAEVRALTSLSVSASDQEDTDRSSTFARAALDVATDLGDDFSVALACVEIGRSLMDSGRPGESLPYFDRAVEVFDDLGARWEYADGLRTRGVARAQLGRLDDAERDLQAALRVSEQLQERLLTRWTWHALASVAERRGDREAATARAQRAAELSPRRSAAQLRP